MPVILVNNHKRCVIDAVCLICGKSFLARTDSIGKYCSQKCNGISRKKKPRNCPICTKEYIPTHKKQIYCGNICRHEDSFGKPSWNKGKKLSTEHIKKLSLSHMGQIHSLGEKNPQWKGDNVGYSGVHSWIGKKYGYPKKCEFCGTTDLKKLYHWSNKDHLYKRKREDFQRLCQSCHIKYDRAHGLIGFGKKLSV